MRTWSFHRGRHIMGMAFRRAVAGVLPARFIRWVGQAQFRYSMLKPLVAWCARGVTQGESVIKHGIGRGLKFDPSGSNPGYALGTTELDEQETLAKYLHEGDVFYD